jgi:integrase
MGRDMARSIHRLTALAVNRATERGYYPDGAGLYLQVSAAGTKSWIFRFTSDGRARDMGIGSLNDFTLAEARQRAKECRQQRASGIDPIEARRAVATRLSLEGAKVVTFKDCAEKYMAAHEPGWRNDKHRDQWHSTLETYAYPIIGDLSAGAVDTALVMKVLEQEAPAEPRNAAATLWATKPETAGRVRGRIEAILDWAAARGFRVGDNPARWKGHLDKLLASPRKIRRVKHHPALPFAEMSSFMAELRTRPGTASRALELAVLTALRTSEVIGARRSEFDLVAKIWTVPGNRMKGDGGREHRVPLSGRAIEIVAALPRDGEFLFPGEKEGHPLSNMAMAQVIRRLNADHDERGLPRYVDPAQDGRDIVPHGFRSTFRDWAAERTNFQNHIVEMALAHAIGDEVEAAYRRGDLFDKRRRLMNAWAEYANSAVEAPRVLQFKAS